jgi:hypothetical protein
VGAGDGGLFLLLRVIQKKTAIAKMPIIASPPIVPPTIAPTGVEELDDIDGLTKAPAVTTVEPDMIIVEPPVTIVEVYMTAVELGATVAVTGPWTPTGGASLPVLRPFIPVKVGKSRVWV